jgi:hypothetical protein
MNKEQIISQNANRYNGDDCSDRVTFSCESRVGLVHSHATTLLSINSSFWKCAPLKSDLLTVQSKVFVCLGYSRNKVSLPCWSSFSTSKCVYSYFWMLPM